jgi:hypothetical protein
MNARKTDFLVIFGVNPQRHSVPDSHLPFISAIKPNANKTLSSTHDLLDKSKRLFPRIGTIPLHFMDGSFDFAPALASS